MLVELPPRFRGGLLALAELLPKLLEAALVGRQQLALFVDRLLALVQRDLERCPTGSGVVPVLCQAAAQRLGVAGQRRELLVMASSVIALPLVALA